VKFSTGGAHPGLRTWGRKKGVMRRRKVVGKALTVQKGVMARMDGSPRQIELDKHRDQKVLAIGGGALGGGVWGGGGGGGGGLQQENRNQRGGYI